MGLRDKHEDLRWLPPGEAELVQRLRGLEWPQPDAELRERCWLEFRRRMGELDHQMLRRTRAAENRWR